MRVYQFKSALIGCVTITGMIVGISGQESSEKSILPAPSAQIRSAPRPGERSTAPHSYTNRIVGGVPSNGRPFMAALLYEKENKLFQYCGASVIGDRWLLTAAHCEVKEGEWAIVNRSDLQAAGGIKIRVEHVYPHQQYDPTTHNNDIALLSVSSDISSAIPRISVAAPPREGTKVFAAGWGLTSENGKQSLKLREVEVPIVTSDQCKSKYDNLTDNMICAGEPGKDSCQGDSGGPLFLTTNDGFQQIGIVSYGVGCGRTGWPGVYTEVDHYRSWIRARMGQ